MKVLQVISSLDPKSGGVAEGAIQQAVTLSAMGHTVDTVTLELPGAAIDARLAPDGVFQLGPASSGYAYAAGLAPWLRQHAAKYQVLVVHGLWQYPGFCVRKVALELGLPYVVFPHGMLDPWFARSYPFKHLKKWLYWPWAQYRVLRDARWVLFTTAEELQLARQSFWLYAVRERLVGFGIRHRQLRAADARDVFLANFLSCAANEICCISLAFIPKRVVIF